MRHVLAVAIAVAVACGVFIALLAACEAASRRWKISAELARKSAHVSCALVAAALPLFMPFTAVAVVALLFVPFMVISRRVGLFPAIHGVERTTLGEMYFPLGVLVVALAVPERVPYAYGLLVMGLSDTAASLAGQRWGHRAYRAFGAWKTYVGSGAFLVTTVVLSVVAIAVAGDVTPSSVAAAMAMAGVLALVEAALGGGTDNLVLPVAGAALLSLLT